MTIDANDKDAWTNNSKDENEFVTKFGKSLGFVLNPEKNKNRGRFLPDLFSTSFNTLADVKIQSTPFITAGLHGVSSERCVTLNVMDLVRYSVYYGGKFLIYFWVRYPENSLNGVYCATCRKIVEDITFNRRHIHKYQTRDGTDGNKTHSFVLDVTVFDRVAKDVP